MPRPSTPDWVQTKPKGMFLDPVSVSNTTPDKGSSLQSWGEMAGSMGQPPCSLTFLRLLLTVQ